MSACWRRAVAVSTVLNLLAAAAVGVALGRLPAERPAAPLTVSFVAAGGSAAAAAPYAPAGGGRPAAEGTPSPAPEPAMAGAGEALAAVAAAAVAAGPGVGRDGSGEGPASVRAGSGGVGAAAGPGTAQGLVRARLLSRVDPVYPEGARREGLAGRTRVRALVGADGLVKAAAVVSSSGSAELDEAAARAVREWRFAPAVDRASGRPVDSYVVIPVAFELK